MSAYKLCETCTIRNCRRRPTYVNQTVGYRCRKRVKIKGGFPFIESAMDNSPVETLAILHAAGRKVTAFDPKKGYKIERR